MRRIRKKKETTCMLTALLLSAAFANMAYASNRGSIDYAPKQVSYERERTAEEWAKLRDQNISWDELQDLVHEYNPTVSKAWLAYRDNENSDAFNLDYDHAMQSIEDAYDAALAASNGDSVKEATAELNRAQSLTMSGIDSTLQNSDARVAEMNVQLSELAMTEKVREGIVSIYTGALQTELSKLTAENKAAKLASAQRREAAGTGTEIETMTAEKDAKDAEAAVQSTQADEIKSRQTLLVNLGFNYNANPTICAVPEVSEQEILSIDPQKDQATGLGNSYAYKIACRKLEVTESESGKAAQELSVTTTRTKVQSDMTSAYNALLTAKNSYDQALLKSQNAKESLAATERSVAVGAASARDLEDARYNASAEEINVSLSKYAMQKAYFSYCAYRDGLAGQG